MLGLPLGPGADESDGDEEELGAAGAAVVGAAAAVVGADDPGAVPLGVGIWARLPVGDGEGCSAPGVVVVVPALVGVAELLEAGAGVAASRTSALAWSWKPSNRLRIWSSGTL